MKLFKTTIVIWSEYNGENVELDHLAREAMMGAAYCAKQETVEVNDPANDPDAPSMEFFGEEEEDE